MDNVTLSPCITEISPSVFTSIAQSGWLTPPGITTSYGLTAINTATINSPANGAGVKIGIFSLGGGWQSTDFNKSMKDLGIDWLINSSKITTKLIGSATGVFNATSDTSQENTLDLYCIAGMVPEANITIYIGTATDSLNILNAMVSDGCDVITISYSSSEHDVTNDFLGTALSNAAAAGITVLAASGDFGTTANGPDAYNNVNYPASNPNVIAVGGTRLITTSTALSTTTSTLTVLRFAEVPEFNSPSYPTGWASGGGMSTLFPVPAWQTGLTYQTNTITINTATHIISAESTGTATPLTGRGVPDISGPMNTYGLWFNGAVTGFGGTSASCPIMAGMIARFIAIKRQRPTNLHSALYSSSATNFFYDILPGYGGNDSNDNTIVSDSHPVYTLTGYGTSTGWDPVTGRGSISDGNALYQVIYPPQGNVKNPVTHSWESIKSVYFKDPLKNWTPVGNVWIKTASGWIRPNTTIPFLGPNISASVTNAQLGGRTDYSGTSNINSNVTTTWVISGGTVSVYATGIPYHSYYNSAAANIPAVQNYSKTWTYRGGTNVSGSQTATGGGKIGLWLNGVSMFNPSAAGGAPGGYTTFANWHYNAAYEEGVEAGYSFGEDNAGAHAAPPNEYHYHDGSMIITGAWTLGIGHTSGTYGASGVAEVGVIPYYNGSLTHPDGHSKIMGICADGYPVYGPYGYATATNSSSGVRRMVSGYAKNPTFVSNGARTTNGTTPPVNSQYPLGIFVEDWSFVGGGDLDTHNGRYCVTPDYPNGTYAYFLAFNSSMKPTYPYVIGNTYYGTPAIL